jgi:hypothetical protein
MPETIDIEARTDIRGVEERLTSHEKFCVERAVAAAKFEQDMRLYLTSLNSKIDHIVSGWNKFVRMVSGVLIVGLIGIVGGLLVYIWQTK